MHEHQQELMGAEIVDLVTGLEGICTAVSHHLNGCVRVCVQPTAADNKPADVVEWCDIQQVRKVGPGVQAELGIECPQPGMQDGTPVRPTAAVGGPRRDAPRS